MYQSANDPPVNVNHTSFGLTQESQYRPSGGLYLNTTKTTQAPRQKRQVGGDWGSDDTDEVVEQPKLNTQPQKKGFGFQNREKEAQVQKTILEEKQQQFYIIDSESLQDESYNYHKQIIVEVIQPAGVLQKPSEAVLDTFVRKSENLDVNAISSCLYSAISEISVPWKSRLRAAYAIERIIKNRERYYKFFKANSDLLDTSKVNIDQIKLDSGKGGQEFEITVNNIKNMISKNCFSEIGDSMNVDTFDPMAMQNQLPDRPKNKGLDFIKKGDNAAKEDDLLGGQQNLIKSDIVVEKKKNAFGFLKNKGKSDEGAGKETKEMNGGFMDLCFDLTGSADQRVPSGHDIDEQKNPQIEAPSQFDLLGQNPDQTKQQVTPINEFGNNNGNDMQTMNTNNSMPVIDMNNTGMNMNNGNMNMINMNNGMPMMQNMYNGMNTNNSMPMMGMNNCMPMMNMNNGMNMNMMNMGKPNYIEYQKTDISQMQLTQNKIQPPSNPQTKIDQKPTKDPFDFLLDM